MATKCFDKHPAQVNSLAMKRWISITKVSVVKLFELIRISVVQDLIGGYFLGRPSMLAASTRSAPVSVLVTTLDQGETTYANIYYIAEG